MSVVAFAESMVAPKEGHVQSEAELDEFEQSLLEELTSENPGSPGFTFVGSAHFRAVDYVRNNQEQLTDGAKKAFTDYLSGRLLSSYGGAYVQSGCIK